MEQYLRIRITNALWRVLITFRQLTLRYIIPSLFDIYIVSNANIPFYLSLALAVLCRIVSFFMMPYNAISQLREFAGMEH